MLLDLDGLDVPVRVRRSPRARRLSIRIDGAGAGVTLVLPAGVPVEEGLGFVGEKAVWIRTRLAALPGRVIFEDGAIVPILGTGHFIRHRPEMRGAVWCEGGEIHVTGGAEHLARRTGDWLRAEARRELTARAHAKAARIDRKISRVAVRETRSRWGSCSAAGNLNFCWRLILAPEPVLDYVVAHEVAHLAEMNHSPAFWALVGELCAEVKDSRAWLRRHGPRLHRYG